MNLNLYNLHKDPKSLHGHSDKATQMFVKLNMLLIDSQESDESVDLILDELNNDANAKDPYFIQALTKILNKYGQDDPSEFIWVLENASDNLISKLGKVIPIKKQPKHKYSVNIKLGEKIKHNRILKHLFSNIDYRIRSRGY